MANPYTDKTRFNIRVSGNPYILQSGFTNEEVQRANMELLYWDFYKGDQWDVIRPPGEPQNTINYCRAFVDKSVAFLMGRGFTIRVTEPAEKITRPFLDEIWDDNNKGLLGLEMAQAGSVTGNAWIKVAVEVFDPEADPDKYEIYPNGRIRIIVLPTWTVFPTWNGHDKDKMESCRVIYPLDIRTIDSTGVTHIDRVWYEERITATEIVELINGEVQTRKPNRLNAIPIVRIKNLPESGNPLGISDLRDIVPLQREYNFKTTDISDIINYHAAPITIVQGAKVGNLEKGARKIWGGIPKDGKVYNLELNSDLKAAMDYIKLIKDSLFEVGRMPVGAFGKEESISNTSGVALHIKNQPLMEITRAKQITYGEGIKEVNKLILKYGRLIEHPSLDLAGFESLRSKDKFWTEVIFPDPLPKDELIQMQLIAQKINLLLQSRKDAMLELGEDPDDLDEIIKEAEDIQNRVFTNPGDALTTNVGGIVDKTEKANPEKEPEE